LSVTRLSLRSEGETSIECSNFVPTIFLLFQAHLYLDHISKEEKQKYMNKMQVLGTKLWSLYRTCCSISVTKNSRTF